MVQLVNKGGGKDGEGVARASRGWRGKDEDAGRDGANEHGLVRALAEEEKERRTFDENDERLLERGCVTTSPSRSRRWSTRYPVP